MGQAIRWVKWMFSTGVLIAIGLLAGCTLTFSFDEDSVTVSQPTAALDRPVIVTATFIAAPTSPPPTTIMVQPTAVPNCTVQADWPVYTVVAGDTVSNLARRTGSTPAALVQANCLADANLIAVGQRLQVPVLPPPPTALPPVTLPVRQGSISVSPFLTADAGNFLLQGGGIVSFRWDGLPLDGSVTRVDWEMVSASGNGGRIPLGADDIPGDGFAVTWLVPVRFEGTIEAIGRWSTGQTFVPEFAPLLYSNDPNDPEGNLLFITPTLNYDGSIYTVPSRQNLTITWPTAPRDAAYIIFTWSPGDRVNPPVTISTDRNLADGAATIWQVEPGIVGIVSAEAYWADGMRYSYANAITLFGSLNNAGGLGFEQPPQIAVDFHPGMVAGFMEDGFPRQRRQVYSHAGGDGLFYAAVHLGAGGFMQQPALGTLGCDVQPMSAAAHHPVYVVIGDDQFFHLCAGVTGKAVELAAQPQADDETGPGEAEVRDDSDGGGQAGTHSREVVGLHPDVTGGERLPPVLFNVAAPTAEVHRASVEVDVSFDGVVKADNAVIALHEVQPAERAHDAR